jgi:hypothetical protein
MSSPDPSSDPSTPLSVPSETELLDSLSEIRQRLALKARTDELKSELQDDWTAYCAARTEGKAFGASPVSVLKTEALAAIAVLKDFHCNMAGQCTDAHMHPQSHAMSVDEGILLAAFNLIAMVDCESF